jgi:2-oxoglutarate dehydrogenase E1 component
MSWRDRFLGVNAGYVDELYERFRRDPAGLDEATRAVLARWAEDQRETPAGVGPPASTAAPSIAAVVGAANLAESIRRYGHLAARLDPLGSRPAGDPALDPATHGIDEALLTALPASLVGGPAATRGTAADAIAHLRQIYCGTIGYDFAHIFVPAERDWLREAAESRRFGAASDPIDPVAILDRLTEVETFERFLHRTFPGKTRFSIEGLDMLVPILDEVLGEAAEAGIRHAILGMAHRGRLNVMAHVLHKPYAQILAEFKDPARSRAFREDMTGTGDVRYHLGASRAVSGGREIGLTVSMPPNPSHLEAIDPVVAGMARAAGTDVSRGGAARFDPGRTLPVLIHGDAAFPGQGVVAETLNLSRLRGYETGGTIHIIANNQLGFTTLPEDAYSTSYASGLARGFKIPIVHVNADDAGACIEVARLASAYRARFQKDFLIDLVGYRRHGHNEGDEPAFTQPVMYEAISSHPTVRERWAASLADRGVVTSERAESMVRERMQVLQRALDSLDRDRDLVDPTPHLPPRGAARRARTAVPLERLRALNESLLDVPDGFECHRKIARARARRRHLLDDPDARTIDWSTAEELAFASILEDRVPIRLTGEDVERGTFSQRHAVLHDVRDGRTYTPLQNLPQARAAFEIHNSPLSENATVGFEYGYSVQAPERLVIWEAQYGDFVNGAQVVIDEFVVSARAKWGQTPSLVFLLPHGQEGQGPDHASARPERFLQLAAGLNLRLANCTTSAQYFHLLRRQATLLRTDPLPLIVLTPKSLLRHPLVSSAARELAEGRFMPVLDDERRTGPADEVRRLVLCSGKVAIDLLTSDRLAGARTVAICRLEQVYPFPAAELEEILRQYRQLEEVVWTQEEPQNMGVWPVVAPLVRAALAASGDGRVPLRYVGRPASASPAEGSAARHALTQQAIVAEALAQTVGELKS